MPSQFRGNKPRVLETSIITGVGTYTLAGAPTGYQPFIGGDIASGDVVPAWVGDGTNWEEGFYTVGSGPATLARTKITKSSIGGAAINWAANTEVECHLGWISDLVAPRAKTVSIAGGAGTQVLTEEEARCDILTLNGALTGNRTIEVSATPWKWAAVFNNTTGAFTVTLKVNGQTGVVLPQGTSRALHCNGTDVTGVDVNTNRADNLMVNPNWQIDQINEGALYTVTGGGANVQGPDGWTGVAVAAPGVFKLRTLADPENAALKCLEITCTTIDATIAATDDYHIESAIEGYDAAGLQSGTADAKPITVQFKFKSSVTGVYGVSIANSAKNRSYVGIITVPDTSEHEYSLTLTMDTAGTWLYTNGVGLYLRLTLAAGSNFQAAAGAWAGANNLTTSAQANFMSNVANIAYLKRIRLVQSSVVSAYDPPDQRKELAKCQRYYEKSYDLGVAVGSISDAGTVRFLTFAGGTADWFTAFFKVFKRASPTCTPYSSATGASGNVRRVDAAADLAAAMNTIGHGTAALNANPPASTHISFQYTANARLS